MSDPMIEADAAGWTAMEPYPGRTDLPWLLKCDTCGYECNKPLGRIRAGRPCLFCSRKARRLFNEAEAVAEIEADAAGWTAKEPYPGWVDDRWLLECDTCGVTSYRMLRSMQNGVGCQTCAGLAPITEAEAVAEVKVAGWTAEEPYPGSVHERWLLVCSACGEGSHKTLSKIRIGQGCLACSGRKPVSEADAIAEIKAAGE